MPRGRLTEDRVKDIIMETLSRPLSLPPQFRDWIPRYLEANQPNLFLNQLLGWNSYIGNNDVAVCSSALTVTTSYSVITGCELTLTNPARYLVLGLLECDHQAGYSLGPNFPGTTSDPGIEWSSESNLTADDGSQASWSSDANNSLSAPVQTTNYGFGSFSSSSTPTGVVATVQADTGSSLWAQLSVALIKGSGVTHVSSTRGTIVDPANLTFTLGDSNDLWGLELSASEIQSSDFGAWIMVQPEGQPVTVSVDYIKLQVYGTSWDETTCALHVGGSPQSPTIIFSEPLVISTKQSSMGFWLIETTGSTTIDLRAKKAFSLGTVQMTTGCAIGALRIS